MDDLQAALERFNRERPYLSNGRTPPAVDVGDHCTLRNLCNFFLTNKRNKLGAGELHPRSFEDYYGTCDVLISHFGRDRRVAETAILHAVCPSSPQSVTGHFKTDQLWALQN